MRGGKQDRGRGRRNFDKNKVHCYKCDKFGHYSYEYWQNNNANKKNKEMDEAHLVQDEDSSYSKQTRLTVITNCDDDGFPW